MRLKDNPLINLFTYTWKYSKGTRHLLIAFIILSAIANIINLAQPLIIGRTFNTIQLEPHDPRLLNHIISGLSLLIAVTFGFWIFHGISRLLETRNAFFVRKNYRQAMINKVMDLSAEWHIDHHSGDTIDKINKASDHLFSYSSEIFIIVSSLVRMIGSVLILFFFDWRSSLVAVLISLIALWSIKEFDKRLKKGYDQQFRLENNLAAAVFDYISNIITIITLKLKNRATKEVNFREMNILPIFSKNNALNELKWFLSGFLISLMVALALIINAYTSYKLTGVIMIGTLFTLYGYLQNVGFIFYDFAYKYGEMLKQDTALRTAQDIELEHNKLFIKKKRFLPSKWRLLQVKNISFSYNKGSQKTQGAGYISDISISITRNQRIAFIGSSGSGKSTTLALLRGLYNPQEGKVYCDGKLLKHGLDHLYEHITLIPQEPEIFNTSIRDNITMGIHDDPKDLDDAVRLAQFKDVLARLKEGYETNVMEKGVNLSGGEKQRLALARGLFAAKDSDFIFMDEPTSSVDSENELKIYTNIFAKFKNKTIIASVHRLHLLKLFDYIYFFADGKIITEGTFKTLLQEEAFQKLWHVAN